MNRYSFFRMPDGRIIHTGGSMSADCVRLSDTEGAALYRAQVCADLRETLKPGATVYCVLRSVSRSGMQRRISLFAVRKGELHSLDYLASRAMGDRIHADGGIVVNGCGMDMGFHLVYSLGRTLYPKGFKLPRGKMGRNGDTSGRESDGGYAFRSSWL